MLINNANYTVLLPEKLKKEFLEITRDNMQKPAEIIRRCMQNYINENKKD